MSDRDDDSVSVNYNVNYRRHYCLTQASTKYALYLPTHRSDKTQTMKNDCQASNSICTQCCFYCNLNGLLLLIKIVFFWIRFTTIDTYKYQHILCYIKRYSSCVCVCVCENVLHTLSIFIFCVFSKINSSTCILSKYRNSYQCNNSLSIKYILN